MRRYLLPFILLASMSTQASTSLRVGNKVLTVGDTAARVQQLMGEPSIRAFKQLQLGAMPDNQVATGEEWQYLQDGRTIIVTVVGGRVVNFETVHD
jgi:hypothetical protein